MSRFLDALDTTHPAVGALMLSSTHLPWLRDFLDRARPGRPLLDPLEGAIDEIMPHAAEGSGAVLALVTEDERFGATEFRSTLDRLGVSLQRKRCAEALIWTC